MQYAASIIASAPSLREKREQQTELVDWLTVIINSILLVQNIIIWTGMDKGKKMLS